MSEKFTANPVTGKGSMSVPIAKSLGRSGFGPELSLSYDSASGNGPFGFGWNLSLPSITRKTDKGLSQYLDCDAHQQNLHTFILSGAEYAMACKENLTLTPAKPFRRNSLRDLQTAFNSHATCRFHLGGRHWFAAPH